VVHQPFQINYFPQERNKARVVLACHLTEEPVLPNGWAFWVLISQFRFRLKGAEAAHPVQEIFPIRTVLSAPHLKNQAACFKYPVFAGKSILATLQLEQPREKNERLTVTKHGPSFADHHIRVPGQSDLLSRAGHHLRNEGQK
jgi:hypothetical protein